MIERFYWVEDGMEDATVPEEDEGHWCRSEDVRALEQENAALRAQLAALREAAEPWVVCEMGIPENWPEDCPLTFEIQPRRQGNVVHRTDVVFNYLPMPCQGIAPLIKDYRALARAMEGST